jgi:hypothetical protein
MPSDVLNQPKIHHLDRMAMCLRVGCAVLADAPKFCRMLKSTVIIQTGLEKYAAALK